MIDTPAEPMQVLDFWFRELRPAQWFKGGAGLDTEVRERFGRLLQRARSGECDQWKTSARGRLALIIVLDQFSRHVHRGTRDAFASDHAAQALCMEAIALGQDEELNIAERHFLYLPLMHAEDLALQSRSLEAFGRLQQFVEGVMAFAEAHREQVARFGRFPYRNAAIGRPSTTEEEAFIASGKGNF